MAADFAIVLDSGNLKEVLLSPENSSTQCIALSLINGVIWNLYVMFLSELSQVANIEPKIRLVIVLVIIYYIVLFLINL